VKGGLEVELKLALTEPGALPRLLAGLPAPRAVVEQDNHYFVGGRRDADAAPVMVRVRVSRPLGANDREPRVVLTLKRRRSSEGGLFVADEWEAVLDSDAWSAFRAGERTLASAGEDVAQALFDWGVEEPLRLQGVMTNRRHEVVHGGFLLEVDQTTFPGGVVEAEVEIETADVEGARACLGALATATGVSLVEQARSKYARFLAYSAPEP